MAAAAVTVNVSGADRVERGLAEVERQLDTESSTRLRTAAGKASLQLLGELRASAARSATPQARIVADAMHIRRDTVVGVQLGGGQSVGSRGTPAGTLLWGSESGGPNFGAAGGGNYWIAPAIAAFSGGRAERAYQEAVDAILRDAGL